MGIVLLEMNDDQYSFMNNKKHAKTHRWVYMYVCV